MSRHVINSLILSLIVGAISACSLVRPEIASQATPVEPEMQTPLVLPPTIPAPAMTRTRAATETSTPVPSFTPSPIPTRQVTQGTPATPTRLPEPHLIDILDWEMVQALSPILCSNCGAGTTIVQAARDLPIAVVQVYIKGEAGSASRLTTDLAYSSPDELTCTQEEGEEFCGLIFGQVVAGRVTLSSEYVGGGQLQLEYLVTFQDWAEYHP